MNLVFGILAVCFVVLIGIGMILLLWLFHLCALVFPTYDSQFNIGAHGGCPGSSVILLIDLCPWLLLGWFMDLDGVIHEGVVRVRSGVSCSTLNFIPHLWFNRKWLCIRSRHCNWLSLTWSNTLAQIMWGPFIDCLMVLLSAGRDWSECILVDGSYGIVSAWTWWYLLFSLLVSRQMLTRPHLLSVSVLLLVVLVVVMTRCSRWARCFLYLNYRHWLLLMTPTAGSL